MRRLMLPRLMALSLVIPMLVAVRPVLADDLFVYSGAGLRPAVQKLAKLYESRTGAKVILDYGGSGQLLTRFKASRKGDVFIPGSKIYFDKLGADVGPTRDIVAHTPVIGVAKAKAGEITQFADLAKPGVRVGLGDPAAMALGRTAEAILDASGMGPAIRKNTVLRAGTVKQLALYVIEGNVDAAIIGRTDAVLNADTIAMVEIPTDWYTPEIVAVGVLATTEEPELARGFTDLLASPEGIAVFESFGFLPAPGASQ